MKIRKRLSLLFICGALLPLVVLSALHYISMRSLGSELAQSTQKSLTSTEQDFLLKTVRDYNRIMQQKYETAETALRLQAREVENILAYGSKKEQKILSTEQFKRQNMALKGSQKSSRHLQQKSQVQNEPVTINYNYPVHHNVQANKTERINKHISKFSDLKDSYLFIKQCFPALIFWQHTTFESGVQIWYPGNGIIPESYAPQQEAWYIEAQEKGQLIWQVSQDPVTEKIKQVVAMPVYTSDDEFAGVTAMHLSLGNLFRALELPRDWQEQAEAALLFWEDAEKARKGQVQVLVYDSFDRPDTLRKGPLDNGDDKRYLDLERSEMFNSLFQQIVHGEPGVKKLPHNDQDMLYAYGSHEPGRPLPLLMLPYEQITAQAQIVQMQVQEETQKFLKIIAVSLLGALLLSTALALFSARTVIRPVIKLARTAHAIAAGDFSSQVKISSGDELQELGETFNDMSWRLQENERMRHALAVARETQQYLLPKAAPKIQDYDISGRSVYSDETGGDYYDFIELLNSGQEKLGIAVGDVSGHGLGVALLMASARGVIRSHAARFSSDLSNLFAMLNEHIIRDTGDGRFLTLFYAILDARNHTLTWNSAGHEPGLLLKYNTGQIVDLPSTGMPLGITREAVHKQAEPVKLEPGDVVLIGTDGIRETRNADREIFGRERLVQLLRDQAENSTQEMLEGIVQSLEDFRGQTSQEDDVTLVAIKYNPEEQ